MIRYRTNLDATFGGILLLTGGVSAAMILATLVLHVVARAHACPGIPIYFLPNLIPHAALPLLTLFVRRRLFQSTVPSWAYIATMVCTAAALWCAFIWFRAPMHDIGLVFGSHGRWGCRLVNADGSPRYIIRDNTVPWVIFLPLILTTAGHWIWSKRQQRQNNSIEAMPDG